MASPAKEFIVPYAGAVRVGWQLKSDGSGANATITVRSSIAFCTASTASAAYQADKCNLRVVAGDRVQAIVNGTFNSETFVFSTAFMRRVRVFYDVVDATGIGQKLID